jgi:hypothetical protein
MQLELANRILTTELSAVKAMKFSVQLQSLREPSKILRQMVTFIVTNLDYMVQHIS